MLLPASLLISLFLLTNPSTSSPIAMPVADDGMWHPSSYAGAATVATTTAAAVAGSVGVPYSQMTISAVAGETTTAAVEATSWHATTTAAVAVTKATTVATAAAASGDWQSVVTWPSGCHSWANPCPSDAIVSGATYTNGFTSYTTETDSNGVITGMPAKATVAAGVSASTLSTAAKATSDSDSSAAATTIVAAAASSKTSSGSFSFSTTKAKANSGAASPKAFGGAFIAAAGLAVALL
jgi:hypothetical protein